jgi:hypothetical protein
LIDLGDSVASTLDVLPSGMVANPNAVLSFLPTSPHAAVVLSSSEAFPTLASGSAADLALQTNTFSSDGSSSLLWTAPQLFYSIPTPAVSTLLLNVSSSSVPNSSEPPPSREQQRQFKLRFDLAVAEYARASGWTEGIRMQPRGLFMEKRAHDEPEWHRILSQTHSSTCHSTALILKLQPSSQVSLTLVTCVALLSRFPSDVDAAGRLCRLRVGRSVRFVARKGSLPQPATLTLQ